jgi:5'-3' exonuclease
MSTARSGSRVSPSVLALDTASLYYRSFHALPSSMRAPDGRPHQAIRGLLATMARLVREFEPQALVAAWDVDWRPDWRVRLVPSYKSHRLAQPESLDFGGPSDEGAEDEPEDLGPQVDAIADLLDALGIQRWGAAEHEADDVLGSLVAQRDLWPDPTGGSVVVSGDRDLVQLIDPHTRLLLTVNGGMEKWPLLDSAAATDRFGVEPAHYVDMAVLRGDASDGLPGLAGVGPKTAGSLIRAFGSLEGVLAAAAESGPRPMTPRIAERALASREELSRAREATRAVRDLLLPGRVPELRARREDSAAVERIARSWGVERQVEEFRDAVVQSAPE